MSDKYFDFDAFMEERRGVEKPFIIKAFGEEHEIPNDVPFDVILEIQRAYKDGQNNMTEDQTIQMCHAIFGEKTFKKWLKKGIGFNGIMLLVDRVMTMYMGNASDQAKRMAKEKHENHPNP